MKHLKILFLLVFSAFIVSSCNNKKETQKKDVLSFDSEKELDNEKTVKKVFFNLPSPIEITQTILATKSAFNQELLNPVSNLSNYSSSSDLALNFGVYGADLCYCRVYDQLQSAIAYLAVIRKLTTQLQIPEDAGAETINRIEENIGNRDSIFQIISETYSEADGYLKENDRELTAALILIGGWVEGMHFAVNLQSNQNNQALISSIAEQKYSLENLISLIEEYKDNGAFAEIYPFFEKLVLVYSNVTITRDKSVIVTDQDTKITSIESETNIQITKEQLNEIKNLIGEIRTKIVS
ncbi:MAG: hypothetical protein WCX31_06790 [Salinivirgaceae bacterium]